MHVRIVKSAIIYALYVLASVSGLSLGMWQNRKHPINRLQTQFNAGIGLISPIQLSFGLNFLGKPRDSNYNLETHGNFLNKHLKSFKNNAYEKPIDARINVVTPQYEITHPEQNELNKDINYYDVTNEANSIFENDETTTTEMTVNTKQMSETTTESTTDSSTETYSTTIDFDLTTAEELTRFGVNPSVLASVLGG